MKYFCCPIQIKDSEMTWKNGKRQMKKDHRWAGGGLDDKDGSGLLSREDKEQLFNEHIEQVHAVTTNKLRPEN